MKYYVLNEVRQSIIKHIIYGNSDRKVLPTAVILSNPKRILGKISHKKTSSPDWTWWNSVTAWIGDSSIIDKFAIGWNFYKLNKVDS